MYDDNNVFAKILRKELPANIVYEDDFMSSFYTIEPLADIHVLVIPKGRYIDYQDFIKNADSNLIVNFFKSVDKVAKVLNIDDSYRLITNYGAKSGQQVFHFHIHLLSGNIKIQDNT